MGHYSGLYWVGIPELTISRKLYIVSPTQRLNINCISTCTPFSILETQENPLLLALPNWEQYCHRRWAGLQCCPRLKMATGSPPPPHVANDRAFPGDRTCSDPTLLPASYRMLLSGPSTRAYTHRGRPLAEICASRVASQAAQGSRPTHPYNKGTPQAAAAACSRRADSSTLPPKFVQTLFSSTLSPRGARGEEERPPSSRVPTAEAARGSPCRGGGPQPRRLLRLPGPRLSWPPRGQRPAAPGPRARTSRPACPSSLASAGLWTDQWGTKPAKDPKYVFFKWDTIPLSFCRKTQFPWGFASTF